MTRVLLRKETHQLHSRSVDRFQASTTVEHDCSDRNLFYLSLCFSFFSSIFFFHLFLLNVEPWLTQDVLQLHIRAGLS